MKSTPHFLFGTLAIAAAVFADDTETIPASLPGIDLSAAQVLSAETEDGKPVYVILQKDSGNSLLLRDNERGGWIGNTYARIGVGATQESIVKSYDPNLNLDAGMSLFAEGSLLVFRGVSLRAEILVSEDMTLKGDDWGLLNDEMCTRRFDNSDFSYSYCQAFLILSANRNGFFNPYFGVGMTFQNSKVENVTGYDGWSSRKTTSGSIDADDTYPCGVFGLEVNVDRVRFGGEIVLSADDQALMHPLNSYSTSKVIFGYKGYVDCLLTDSLSIFAEVMANQATSVYGGGIGWRF